MSSTGFNSEENERFQSYDKIFFDTIPVKRETARDNEKKRKENNGN